LEKLLPLDLENFLKMTVSVHFLSDSNYIWYTNASWRDTGEVQIWVRSDYYWRKLLFIHLQLPQSCWNDFTESW
jgi:hypothetical protein